MKRNTICSICKRDCHKNGEIFACATYIGDDPDPVCELCLCKFGGLIYE